MDPTWNTWHVIPHNLPILFATLLTSNSRVCDISSYHEFNSKFYVSVKSLNLVMSKVVLYVSQYILLTRQELSFKNE